MYLLPLLFGITFSVLLTLFLEFCFREGNIFGGWIPFVSRTYHKLMGIELDQDNYEWHEENCFICKPLGSCCVCFGFWVSVLIMIPFSGNILVYFYSILLSNFLIRFFYERII